MDEQFVQGVIGGVLNRHKKCGKDIRKQLKKKNYLKNI